MAWTSKVPAVIDALVQRFTVALPDIVVRDGPAVESSAALEVLSVGWTGSEDTNDVEAQLAAEGLRPPDREQITIRCAAAVLRGSTEVAAARARAYDIFQQAGATLAVDRTLGGLVLQALIGDHSLTQDQTDRGMQAVVTFSVSCDAYTGR